MAGLYVHIPFCRTRCVYCGFFSTTLHKLQGRYADAVLRELDLRAGYLRGERVETVYIGGGTPSQLALPLLRRIILGLPRAEEFTVECNPDDVDEVLASELVSLGVNRVSMGVQSFSDERLRFLRRRHTAEQARRAVETLRSAGLENISIDLMFGFPGQTLADWRADIAEALSLDVPHISAYSLMYEEGTPLFQMLERGEVEEIDEELSRTMFFELKDSLEAAGYEHYEISNFARKGFRSRHNSAYWRAVPYLGLGAGAHSYDRLSRQWNVSDVALYINKVEEGTIPAEREELDAATRYNDLVTTALRTREGMSTEQGEFSQHLMACARPLLERNLLVLEGNRLRLSRQGLYVSDEVMAELIFV